MEINKIICHLHKVDLEECKKDLQKIKEHINYARERQDTCFMKGDLAGWRAQKKKLRNKKLKRAALWPGYCFDYAAYRKYLKELRRKQKIHIKEIPVNYSANSKRKKGKELIISNLKLPPFKNGN